MSLRIKLERFLREFRSYLIPSHRKAAREVIRNAQALPKGQPLCVFDFKSIKIDNESGRYLHHLITEFENVGYAIAYVDRFRFLATFNAKTYKKLLLSHSYSIVAQEYQLTEQDVRITDHKSLKTYSGKTINVVYECVRPSRDDSKAFCFPFFIHPKIHESGQISELAIEKESKLERSMRIFFAGNAKAPKYDDARLADVYGMMSRVKALNTAESHLGGDKVRHPSHIDQLITTTSDINAYFSMP